MKYTAKNLYDPTECVSLVQDCKHVMKKIRNSIFSSKADGTGVRQLQLGGKFIFWDLFEAAYDFNCKTDLRLYRKLSKDHVKITDSGKMCNHLAINVLNYAMLHLMKNFQNSLPNPSELDGTVKLLENTSVFVDIFCNNNSQVESLDDPRIGKLLNILSFFHEWEQEFETPQQRQST